MWQRWWNSASAQKVMIFGIPTGVFVIAVGSLFAGVILWGGFNTAMEATNDMEFCISCHEMENTVYKEYTQTVHFQNGSGVQATCPDCHVPRPWIHKMVRKIQASGELYHKVMGTIDTPEKFEERRLYLAKKVWTAMKETDSRECRNCHAFDTMKGEKQKKRAAKQHASAQEEGLTCIDCHKGIAHKPVHHLLEEEEEEEEMEEIAEAAPAKVEKVAAAPAAPAPAPAKPAAPVAAATQTASAPAAAGGASAAGAPDWTGVAAIDMTLFYPGQASLEWVLKGSDHGGARVFKKGERCSECHRGEEADMGAVIVSGEKAEATPIPGKRASIATKVQATHDGSRMFIRMQWPDGEHNPVPFVDGGKMDPANQVKVAMMITGENLDMAARGGCWATCHHDSRYMPDAPDAAALGAAADVAGRIDVSDGVTKYLPESRGKLEIKGRGGKKRGAWDKLNAQADNDAALAANTVMDLLRVSSGNPAAAENGYVFDQRVMDGGQAVESNLELKDGVWTLTFSRELAAANPGDVPIEPGKTYMVGFAIHDDYTSARFHHVSLDYTLALDLPEADINVVKK